MRSSILIEPHYFGSLAYFSAILQCDRIVMEQHSHYTKQTYKNRCILLGPQGAGILAVPVHNRNHTPLKEVKIDYSQNWVKVHKGMLQSAYGRSPFFDFFYPEILMLWEQRHEFLFDLSLASVTSCLKWLQVDRQIELAIEYSSVAGNEINDLREVISPKKPDNLSSFYDPVPYFQNFGNNFVPNLSVLDCLMNVGPESVDILKKSLINQ